MADGAGREDHRARIIILLVLAALAVGLVAVTLATTTRSPASDSRPAITASPVPVGADG